MSIKRCFGEKMNGSMQLKNKGNINMIADRVKITCFAGQNLPNFDEKNQDVKNALLWIWSLPQIRIIQQARLRLLESFSIIILVRDFLQELEYPYRYKGLSWSSINRGNLNYKIAASRPNIYRKGYEPFQRNKNWTPENVLCIFISRSISLLYSQIKDHK